ncbi:MAG: protein-disulfide reductase DsbD family protein, partial [Myxococcota bacterium]|nr:protein-disulfide reductase DsbD family protein [Myxococcota bacterium]
MIRITDRRAARVDAEFVGRLRAAAIALALLPLCAAPALGAPRAEGAFDEDEPRLAATLLVHPDDDPAGQRVRVGVWFEPDPGWHLYWRNPGETGLPTRIEFQVEGGRAGPLAWPAPRAFREAEGELTTYGYDEPVLLAAELGFDAPAAGPRRLRARADVLVCETQCIPATLELERALAPPTPDEAPALRARFAAAAAALPEPPGRLGVDLEARAAGPEAGIAARLGVFPCRSAADAQACAVLTPDTEAIFFPDLLDGQALAPLGVERDPDHPDGFWVALAGEPGTEAPTRVRGVLALRGLDGERRTVEVDLPLAPAQPASVASAVSLWTALLLAFVGGLLLNLMPCVLPVLAIKVVGLAELAHRPRREALALAGAYAAGVLATMGVLAALVVGLRAAGHAVGWGFQFQEPLF